MKYVSPSGLPKTICILLLFALPSCYQYRVLNTKNDPSTEYQKKVLWSYAWGLVNKPKNFVVPNCDNSNAMDEVQFRTNFGYALIMVASLGIVAPVQVQWKCHKPCPREGGL
jgi:hypothetical protein